MSQNYKIYFSLTRICCIFKQCTCFNVKTLIFVIRCPQSFSTNKMQRVATVQEIDVNCQTRHSKTIRRCRISLFLQTNKFFLLAVLILLLRHDLLSRLSLPTLRNKMPSYVNKFELFFYLTKNVCY